MNLKKETLASQLRPHRSNHRWFYLTDGRDVEACSFHSAAPGEGSVFGISVTALLRAIDKCGFLDRWDRKQQVLRKEKP